MEIAFDLKQDIFHVFVDLRRKFFWEEDVIKTKSKRAYEQTRLQIKIRSFAANHTSTCVCNGYWIKLWIAVILLLCLDSSIYSVYNFVFLGLFCY